MPSLKPVLTMAEQKDSKKLRRPGLAERSNSPQKGAAAARRQEHGEMAALLVREKSWRHLALRTRKLTRPRTGGKAIELRSGGECRCAQTGKAPR